MASLVKTIFILTGGLAGQTKTLGRHPYPFVDGKMELVATPDDMALHARFLERNWQAYPEGHPALEEAPDGERDIQTDSQQNSESQVSGDLQPDGQGPEAGSETDDSAGTTETEAGQAGSVSDGDGQPAELNAKLLKAVKSLDPTNDEHWTQDGKPAINAVTALYGSTDVTRKDVETVAPGYTREAAEQPAE